ncbi:nucleotidyltransferase domain-containing protein [Halalkalibacillus sediminis]|uniref:Nucleotidyltransferase domain-containing protein n=1 Tax=Halalkalibacillus sediminis TaxID=2018042 RepID=A0A2I0QQU3_9BACI|nr:nucleotidyltransferase domain-containing protein [Halalkalibacillus sediminis]PKR76707.1 nucleotidyltransferase domain-containing protein [Halalkalibacillus sediminis]
MEKINRLAPLDAAHKIINNRYPASEAALLAGSVVRAEATETSDLDIVIFDKALTSSYRESFIELDWKVEVFVHSLTSYREFFQSDYERARPSLPRMVAEGIVLKDNGIIDSIKEEANHLLSEGPEEWPTETIDIKRYFITDALDDFIGCTNRAEEIFIANTLAELVSEFVLRTNRRWMGASKWVVRSLKDYDEEFADRFVEALDMFYKYCEKDGIVKLVDDILESYGGRLFEGFSLGKN